jgi:hypothetical protein
VTGQARGRSLLAAVVLVIGVLAVSSAQARAPLVIGVQDDPVFVRLPSALGESTLSAESGLADAKELGAKVIRISINWDKVASGPAADEQDWAPYDAAIARAKAAGFTVQLALTGPAPAFATANHLVGVIGPSPNDFGAFAAAAAARYSSQVKTFSIWNEPNWWDQLKPVRRAAAIYRRMYQLGYAAIKRYEPRAQVLIGELAPMGRPAGTPPLQFLRALTCRTRRMRPLRHCQGLVAGGLALHPYTLRWRPTFPGYGPNDVTTGSLGRLVHVLNQLARVHALSAPDGRPLGIYLSEYGWRGRRTHFTESQRAAYATGGFTLAYRQPRVKEIVWYQLSPPPLGFGPLWDTALLGVGNQISQTFRALQQWVVAMDSGLPSWPGCSC